jgi:hypothetical protein
MSLISAKDRSGDGTRPNRTLVVEIEDGHEFDGGNAKRLYIVHLLEQTGEGAGVLAVAARRF